MNAQTFISVVNGFVMAPAGHGKTHTIVECLVHAEGNQLILTHTHAGIASIREKIKKVNPDLNNFNVETITGYAQKYVLAYYRGDDIPDPSESDRYYHFIVQKAAQLFSLTILKKVIASSYTGVFVDEYQDCSVVQHVMIMSLAKILPTYVLGDPLQGIFNFKGEPMVDLENEDQMASFVHNKEILGIPWRWKNKNENLGDTLNKIRDTIIRKQPIDLRLHPSLGYVPISSAGDIYNPGTEYGKLFATYLKMENLLIIHPESTSINPRKKIVSAYKTPISLIESIDDKDFYRFARLFDNSKPDDLEKAIATVSLQLFSKTVIHQWFNDDGLKSKKSAEDKIITSAIRAQLSVATTTGTKTAIAEVFNLISNLKDVRCYRKELFYTLCNALRTADENQRTVLESMEGLRNVVRKVGRKNYRRCIGTTLLTKGLEFDNVIILNAQSFDCPKNLYVALTRASKKLIVFSTTPILNPYS
ncbi:MAG: hypothetical protein E6H09_07750 [Bacteroidetes bacterium]|jgi:superfamily I DNA/RNA helicase|nr:MAG: hypothetical protein E6H09_07750 [Bacteroidota bacterium]